MRQTGWIRAAFAVAAVVAAGLPGKTRAQTVDISRGTCAEFVALSAAERAQLALWLHGFYSGAALRAQIDRARLADLEPSLRELCGQHPTLLLIGSELRGLVLLGREASPLQNSQPVPGTPEPAPQPAAPDRPTPVR